MFEQNKPGMSFDEKADKLWEIHLENDITPGSKYYDEVMRIVDIGEVFTEAQELSSGIFWFITDDRSLKGAKFLRFDFPVERDGDVIREPGLAFNAKSGKTYNHKALWESEVQNNPNHKPYNKKPYDYYPRGRVEIANNRATIHINPNLNKPFTLLKIKAVFGLSPYNIGNVRVMPDHSDHYKCWIDREE